ncbi:MAG TPA: alpha/beta hydrolase [Polyangiaceae bacterium]|jgi:pimeloyl-ACP methyl ester carboxylesterase
MPSFTRGDTSIYYEEHGSGPPLLVFAPGGMQSRIELLTRSPYHPVIALSDAFRVITMDQRNAGASHAPVSAGDGWHSYTDDHLALLDELKIDRCHVLGMCVGGAFALSLTVAAPERVRCAVLQQPIGFDGTNRAAFYQLFDTWAAELMRERADVLPQALPPFRERMYGGDFVFSVPRAAVERSAVPLLVLRGNDAYHPTAISEEIARIAPQAELVQDWKTGEDLSRAVTRVRSFLAEH